MEPPYQFFLVFWSNWPTFSLILDLFDPSYFSQNLRSDWVHFFRVLSPLQNILWSTPPPPSPLGGWHSHTWIWGVTSALLTPVFDICRSHWVPFYAELNLIDPLFLLKKIGFSLSHLFPEIIWPKVGLIFNKNLSFDHFEAFCVNFLLDFRSCWPPFLQFLDLFDPSFLQNLRSCWVHFFIACWIPLPKIWWNSLSKKVAPLL